MTTIKYGHQPEQLEEQRLLCIEMPEIQARLFKAGLLKTGHAMNAAIHQLGFERAEIIEAVSARDLQ